MGIRLFVGNLPYNATEADLREHFGAVGPLSYVYLPTDRETGKQRGFAFVEYAEQAHAREAILRFDSQPFKGRPVSVSEAVARDQRPLTPRPRPAAGAGEIASSPGPIERSFGPDATPRRPRKQSKTGAKGERVPKGPIRERRNARVVFGADDDGAEDDDLMGENFASRAEMWEDDTGSEES